MFDRCRVPHQDCADQPRQEIAITLPDGSQRKGTSWETSPMDIAKEISKGLADRVIIAKVSHTELASIHGTRNVSEPGG